MAQNPSTTSMKVATNEDQMADTERSHTSEQLDYVVLSATGLVQLIPTTLAV